MLECLFRLVLVRVALMKKLNITHRVVDILIVVAVVLVVVLLVVLALVLQSPT
jgi:uncharacterized membrane protein YidH (DUF202 family)